MHRSRFGEGVVHSFDGSMEEMLQLVELGESTRELPMAEWWAGLYIGINGCSLRAGANATCAAAELHTSVVQRRTWQLWLQSLSSG